MWRSGESVFWAGGMGSEVSTLNRPWSPQTFFHSTDVQSGTLDCPPQQACSPLFPVFSKRYDSSPARSTSLLGVCVCTRACVSMLSSYRYFTEGLYHLSLRSNYCLVGRYFTYKMCCLDSLLPVCPTSLGRQFSALQDPELWKRTVILYLTFFVRLAVWLDCVFWLSQL